MRIAFLNWRDSTHPEGGGAEKYAETVCEGLARAGHDVTLLCAAHGDAPAEEVRAGVRVLRQGGRKGVYAASLRRLASLERADGRFDVVVDTQNGVPFWAGRVTRTPVVVLVHHVHREQWPIVFGAVSARVGWFLESRVAPSGVPRAAVRRGLRAHPRRARRGSGWPLPPSPSSTTAPNHHCPHSCRGTPSRGSSSSGGSCPTSGSSTPSRWSPDSLSGTRRSGCGSSATAGGATACATRP